MCIVVKQVSTIVVVEQRIEVPSADNCRAAPVQELNVKAKSFVDLLSSTPFERKDIITLQKPGEVKAVGQFAWVKEGKRFGEKRDGVRADGTTARVMRRIEAQAAADAATAATAAAASSTAADDSDEDSEELRQLAAAQQASGLTSSVSSVKIDKKKRVRTTTQKGYVRLETNAGNVSLELHCDLVPKTCENFLLLAERGAYNGSTFHRVSCFLLVPPPPLCNHTHNYPKTS